MTWKCAVITIIIILLLALGISFLYSLWFDNVTKTVRVGDNEFVARIADDDVERERGLGGVASLADNEGMLFLFSGKAVRSFWMKGMTFPIDLLWISDNVVVAFEAGMQPERGVSDNNLRLYPSPQPVDTVLELNSGVIEKFNIQAGDRVRF